MKWYTYGIMHPQASTLDDPMFAALFHVVDNRCRSLQASNVGVRPDRCVALPAPVLRAMFATSAWDVRTPEGLQQGLVFLLIRDLILRVNQVYLMKWCVLLLVLT
jgi:hypothetical protein